VTDSALPPLDDTMDGVGRSRRELAIDKKAVRAAFSRAATRYDAAAVL